MARFSVAATGPASSTGSPTTLMMRPSVPSPTGIAIAWPVSVTSWPRTRPSLESIAMVRTVDSPKCCATSSTRRLPRLVVSSALRIAGRSSSNFTSTTAPMTWVMRPTRLVMARPYRLGVGRESHGFGAGDDLDQLLGDHGLAGAVIGERLLADHLAGIAGGVVHCGHLRAVERSGVLHQGAENLHRDIARQELGKNVLLIRLILVHGAAMLGGRRRKYRRDELLRGRYLGHDRFEPREEQGAHIEAAGVEPCHDVAADPIGMLEPDLAHRTQIDRLDDAAFVLPLELVKTLAADAEKLDVLAVG